MPRSDSFNARVRGTSHIDFKTATTGVAAKAMRNELSSLVNTVKEPQTKRVRIPPPVSQNWILTTCLTGFRHRDAIFLLPLHPLSHRARKEPRTVCIPLTRVSIPAYNQLFVVTGTVSNRPQKIRLFHTASFHRVTSKTSTSLPSSRSMVVWVPQWVCFPSQALCLNYVDSYSM